MPLGDSITQGTRRHEGYRPLLWQRLRAAGYDVDFVGSLDHLHPFGRGEGYDHDHEGHWGWRVDQVLALIDVWARDAAPDIVLLHLGTNDLGAQQSIESTFDELRLTLDAIRRHRPRVAILLAEIIPGSPARLTESVRQFNAYLAANHDQLATPDSPVILVDHYTGFDPRTDTYDGVHPNAAGATKMADAWFDALAPLLEPQPEKSNVATSGR